MNKMIISIFTIYLVLGLYFLSLAISKPLIYIELTEKNGHYYINETYYPKWAKQHEIDKGDLLISVDQEQPIHNPAVQKTQSVIEANELILLKSDGAIRTISISHFDLPEQLFTFLLFPMLYFVLSIFLTIYLWRKNKGNFLTTLLILFLLSTSLAYISSIASSRLNQLGAITIDFCIILCLVILIHFLEHYFRYLHIKWPFIAAHWLYLLPLLILLHDLMEIVNPAFTFLTPVGILFIFSLLVFCTISILLVSYLQTQSPKLRIIAISLIVPFMPFLFLFVVPEIIGRQAILSSEISALFLLLIPFSFIFIYLNEQLLDLEFQLSRIRYYSALAFSIAFVLTMGITILLSYRSIAKMTGVFIWLFIGILAGFYLKERLDFMHRKIIFSTNDDYVQNLYAAVHRIGSAKNQQELEARFTQELSKKFGSATFSIETITNEQPLTPGEMIMDYKRIQLVLHNANDAQIVLSITNSIPKKDLLWLELLALYFSMFVDNLKHIEDLVEEIHRMKVASHTQLPWLDKILWNILEKEKNILAQELHDTILQEQLHLARELDIITGLPFIQKERVLAIREQLLEASQDLRDYCENLSPPLLDTFGLHVALKKLIQKVKIRANFLLDAQIDRVNFEEPSLHLVVYRIVQELLNNAIKHADATKVKLHLTAIDRGFVLQYEDDGIGCHLDEMNDSTTSMGINGIRERVRAYSGDMTIFSRLNEGLHITIQIQEESEHTHD